MLTASDGAQIFYNWHDTQLDLDCIFLPAADGQLRCLPESTSDLGLSLNSLVPTLLFSDAACSTVVALDVQFTPACHPDAGPGADPGLTGYYQWFQAGTTSLACDGGGGAMPNFYRMFTVGDALAACPASVFKISGTTCVSTTCAYPTVYAATEVPPSTFVSATIQ